MSITARADTSLRRALFSKHLSYKMAAKKIQTTLYNEKVSLEELMKRPQMLELHEKTIEAFIGSLCLHLMNIKKTLSEDEIGDKFVLETFLHTIHGIGSSVFNECKLESVSDKNLVGGHIDVIIGSETNGDRPRVTIQTDTGPVTLFSVVVGEAKYTGVGIVPSKRLKRDYLGELLTYGQPVLELLTLAELCTFPNENVPVVAIYGNRLCFRPLLYFAKSDILLSTPAPIQYTDSGGINTVGLGALYAFVKLHLFPFDETVLTFPKCGWREAVQDAYTSTLIYATPLHDENAAANQMPPDVITEEEQVAIRKRKLEEHS